MGHEYDAISYSILFYPITLEGRRGTIGEYATIPFHLVLFSAALVELAKSIPVHSLISSSHLFFCLPLFLFPFTVSCRIVFAKPEDLETWPSHLSFHFLLESGLCHILQWLLGTFCVPSIGSMVLGRKCSIASGSISSQKPAFFLFTLRSRSMIHKQTEIWK